VRKKARYASTVVEESKLEADSGKKHKPSVGRKKGKCDNKLGWGAGEPDDGVKIKVTIDH